MNPKNLTLEIAVVAACYLILMIPISSATTVNIKYNGQVMETVEYDPSNIVNQHITYVKDTSDISWSNVRVAITLNSASLSHTVRKVYLYKCGALSPVSCMQKTPEVFDSYVDTEIAWTDIGQSTGSSIYPQEGNLLFLVKLEDPDGLSSWVGLWNTIKRSSHREFLFYRHELSDVDIHAESSTMIDPIATYIQNFNTIPFKWLTKASFGDALSITAIGGDDSELEATPPVLQSVSPSSTDIDVINKQNYFVFPETSSGTAFPITLVENPDFQCGDSRCEGNLGETKDTCCYDCLCGENEYCDAPQEAPEEGDCKPKDLIDLEIVGTPSADVVACQGSFDVGITARINNVPVSMSDEVTGVIKIANTPYSVQCAKASPGLYDCSFTMRPTIQCGSGTRTAGPNELKLTVSYMDGTARIITDLLKSFPSVNLNYDCDCGDGYYCDTGTETCETEDAIRLGITELTSYLDAYSPGDTIRLKAKIFNPPTGTVLVSASAGMNLTNGIVSPGTPQCTGPSEDYEYDCTIPFSITGYTNSKDYKFYPNTLSFEITYNDGPSAQTKGLSTQFGPISIPNQECGNGVPDPQETSESCCQDVGCEAAGDYCDVARGCTSLDSVSLSVTPIPREFEDCKAPHDVKLRTTINNAPYGSRIDSYSLDVMGQPVAWSLECPREGLGGIFDCYLTLPPQEGCELPFYTVGPNRLSMSLSFPNGDSQTEILTKDISADFDDIYVTPIPHIDGTCEPELGENGSSACLDCPCADDPDFGDGYYCDTGVNPKGTCLSKSDISLVVESPDPASTVSFDSCEKTNKLSVLMHIKNQPSTMDAESVFATVNNEAAGYVSCRESTGTYLDSNVTFNCTIQIPRVSDCESGKVYTYSNNSISMVISYDNGQGRPVLQTLTHPIASASISQSYRSLNEISNEAVAEMTGVLHRIQDITADSMDAIQDCYELQIAVFIINLIGTMLLGYAVGTAYSKEAGGSWKQFWEGFGEGAKTAGALGSSLSEMIGKICDALRKISEIEVRLQELQLEKIKMNTCLAVSQHALDAGDCYKREESCFDSIVGCLSFGEIRSIMSDISGLTEGINKDFLDANGAIVDIGNAFADADLTGSGTGREFSFRIKLQDRLDDNYMVCENNDFLRKGESNECKATDTTGYVSIGLGENDCSRKRVVLTVNKVIVLRVDISGNEFTTTRQIPNLMGELQKDSLNEIELFCTDENTIEGNSISINSKYKKLGSTLHIARGVPVTDICGCSYGGATFVGIGRIPSSKSAIPTETDEDRQKVCNFEPGTEYIVTRDSQLGEFYLNTGFVPYESTCKIFPSGTASTITTLSNYVPVKKNGKYFWKVSVNKKYTRNCADNTQGWMLISPDGSSCSIDKKADMNPSSSETTTITESEKTTEPISEETLSTATSQKYSGCGTLDTTATYVMAVPGIYGSLRMNSKPEKTEPPLCYITDDETFRVVDGVYTYKAPDIDGTNRDYIQIKEVSDADCPTKTGWISAGTSGGCNFVKQ